MPHVLKGRLCGYMCDDCNEPLAGLIVRIYRPLATDKSAKRAVAASPEALTFLSDDDVKAKADRLIAEVQTDAYGNYEANLERGRYDGGPIEIDLYCRTVPRKKVVDVKAVQVPITIWQPKWDDEPIPLVWDHCLRPHWWCGILAWFGVWTVCGRLTTCEGAVPIPGATVTALDADCIQDDTLGSGITDSSGRFRISFTANDFQKTPFSPLLNFEHGGPDLYFRAEFGGNVILQEPSSRGRTPGRENVGTCTCVELCSTKFTPETPIPPVWLQLEDFDVHPAHPTVGAQFSDKGYAGDPSAAYVFGGDIPLRGKCPLSDVVTGNALEYRFTIGAWTWAGGDPAASLPSVPPTAAMMEPVTQIARTTVGYILYADANGIGRWGPVYVTAADSTDGWIKLLGRPVSVPMYDGTDAIFPLTQANFAPGFDLLRMHSEGITPPPANAANPPRLTSLPVAEAGRSLDVVERQPVRRYAMAFEVRDAQSKAMVHSDTLSAVVLDNTPVISALALEELLAVACKPLTTNTLVHLLFTVEHPHLKWYEITISRNSGLVHSAPPLPTDAFAGNVLFRGGAGGAHLPSGLGGVPVDITNDLPCSYRVRLSWTTRHYHGGSGYTEVLYCR